MQVLEQVLNADATLFIFVPHSLVSVLYPAPSALAEARAKQVPNIGASGRPWRTPRFHVIPHIFILVDPSKVCADLFYVDRGPPADN